MKQRDKEQQHCYRKIGRAKTLQGVMGKITNIAILKLENWII